MDVSRPFPFRNRSMLTEICLCHACSSGPEILRTETGGQELAQRFLQDGKLKVLSRTNAQVHSAARMIYNIS
jgi:hypothetical protein